MATEAAAPKFFRSAAFAVVGTSSNPTKIGHQDYGLDVTGVNPASATVTINGNEHATVATVAALPNPKNTAVSIITPPGVTVGVLREARTAGVPSVWLQPGTWNDEVLRVALADGAFETVVYGEGGRGHGGWCVLVDGEKALDAAGKL